MPPVLTKNGLSDNEDSNSRDSAGGEPRRKKKRASRWTTGEDEKTVIPGMPSILPSNLTKEQEKAYLTQLRIEDITRMLRSGELGIPKNQEDRSPSPEPVYDSQGKRLNTREVRQRTKLEAERHKLVQEMLKLNPEYKPPLDYKPPANKFTDKVFIPQEDYPEINFVGLLIGPRGNTLKMLEKDSCAKIIIRGKGSVKEGKINARLNGQPLPGEDEPLHAYITGSSAEAVASACEKVRDIIKQGIEQPEAMNDLRKAQLRELALINGTLRENDGLNKLKVIAQAQTVVTNTIICGLCGGAGHITSDCKMKKEGVSLEEVKATNWSEREKMDSEYHSLMAELGEEDTSKPNPGGKSVVSRGGASNTPVLAIESTKSADSATKSSSSSSVDLKPPPLMSVANPFKPAAVETGSSHSAAQPPAVDPYAAAMAGGYPPYYMSHYMMQWPGYSWPYQTPGAVPPTTGTGAAQPPLPPPPPPPPS